jgi:DNA polymerase-4
VSCEQTFETDINENAAITIHLYHIVLELVRRIEKNDFEGRTLTLKVKFAYKKETTVEDHPLSEEEHEPFEQRHSDFQQITRSTTVDHILKTKDDILPLAKQLMKSVDFHNRPIRLLGLGVSNQKSATQTENVQWKELELEFEPWPEE